MIRGTPCGGLSDEGEGIFPVDALIQPEGTEIGQILGGIGPGNVGAEEDAGGSMGGEMLPYERSRLRILRHRICQGGV